MSDDNHLHNAFRNFVFYNNSMDDNNSVSTNMNNSTSTGAKPSILEIKDQKLLLEKLTRELIRAVSINDSQEYVSLSPSITMLAIHSMGRAASFCMNLTEEDDNPDSLPFAAVEFMTTAFGYLEPDLVYTALRVPLSRSASSSNSNSSSTSKSSSVSNSNVTIIDVIVQICEQGTTTNSNSKHSTKSLSSSLDPWYDSKLRVFAFMSLCRCIQAAETIQKVASSMQPYPFYPEDSALGAGMGLGLDSRLDVMETICHLAVDYIINIDTGAIENKQLGCNLCSNPTNVAKEYQSCECESHRNRGYLYTACVVYLSTLLRSNMSTWLHFNNSRFESSGSQRQYTEQRTFDLCEALARCICTLQDPTIKLQGRIAAYVSVSLFSLILKHSLCHVDDLDGYVFLESMTEHVMMGALTRSANLDSDTTGGNHRAQYVMRKRAIIALSDVLSQNNKILDHPTSISSIEVALEECCIRILRMGGMAIRDWEDCLLDPGLEGDLMCFLVMNTHCRIISRQVLKRMLIDKGPHSPSKKIYASFQDTDPLSLIIKSLMRLSLSERFNVSACSSSILRSIINDNKGNPRSDILTRKLWEIIERPSFCQQDMSLLLVHTLVFLKKNCDLKNLDCGEEFNPNAHLGFSEGSFKIQLQRSEPRLCSLLDLFLFFCTGDVLRHVKLETDFCSSTLSVFGYISASYVGNGFPKSRSEFEYSDANLINTKSNLTCAVAANVENIMVRLGHLDNVGGDGGKNEDHGASICNSECQDRMTSQSLIKGLGLITKHKIIDEGITSDHASVGNTVASCLVQGNSRDLIRRGITLHNVVEKRNIEFDLVSKSVFETCSLHDHRLKQNIASHQRKEQEILLLRNELTNTRKELDQSQFTLHMKTAHVGKEMAFVRSQASTEAMALVDSHVLEREVAEKRAAHLQHELELVKNKMVSMETKLIETTARLTDAESSIEKEREQTEQDFYEANLKIETLQKKLKDEKNVGKSLDRALKEKIHDLNKANEALDGLKKENTSMAENYQSLIQHQKGSDEKIESAFFKLIALAKKYREKENIVHELNKRFTDANLGRIDDGGDQEPFYLLQKHCENLLNQNTVLIRQIKKNPQKRNNSAIALALQEMEAEVPKAQGRDDRDKSRGRSLSSVSRNRSSNRGRSIVRKIL